MGTQNNQILYTTIYKESFSLDIGASKEDKFFFVSLWILKLEAVKPNLKWKTTELSLRTGLSRSWIYKYFGSNQKDLLNLALKIILQDFYGESAKRTMLKEKYGTVGTIFRSRAIFQNFPEVLVFYYKNRINKNSIGETIRSEEQAFFKRLGRSTGLKGDLLYEFFSSLHGVATAFSLTDEQVNTCVNSIVNRFIISKNSL